MKTIQEIKTRLGWLLIGLVASLMTASVITGFEHVLEKNLILVSFIPLIVYMSDAVGTQMEAIIIRELNKKSKFSFSKFFKKQLVIVIPVAILIGLVAGIILQVWKGDSHLSYTIGFALVSGIMTSLITGALLPYMFWKMHEDPAEASGPIATVLQDFLSIVVFFYIAQYFF